MLSTPSSLPPARTCHRPRDVGRTPHGKDQFDIIASLPTWWALTLYERGCISTLMNQYRRGPEFNGYPRFTADTGCRDVACNTLGDRYKDGDLHLVLASRRAAEAVLGVSLEELAGTMAPGSLVQNVFTDPNPHVPCGDPVILQGKRTADTLMTLLRQHLGQGASRRQLAALGEKIPVPQEEDPTCKQQLQELIAGYAGATAEDVYLFPNGMSTVAMSLLLTRNQTRKRTAHNLRGTKTVQCGSAYLDSLRLQQAPLGESLFVPALDDDGFNALKRELQSGDRYDAILAEFPGNPLLNTPDLGKLREIADKHGVPLIIDDTLGAVINAGVLPYADIVTTSLTKYFSGHANVMGGSLMLNPGGGFYTECKDRLHGTRLRERLYHDALWNADAAVLLEQGKGLLDRVDAINPVAASLVAWLRENQEKFGIQAIHYCDDGHSPQTGWKDGAGRGGVFSLVLEEPGDDCARTARFYDALRMFKAASFGAEFSIACAYPMLAHFRELKRVQERYGFPPQLIRFSIGREPLQDLQAVLECALTSCGSYRKCGAGGKGR